MKDLIGARYIVVLALLTASVQADSQQQQFYSFSPPVGSGSGTSYTLAGMERITAVRVWEVYSNYIQGIQLRHGSVWSSPIGVFSGTALQFDLREDEAIVQVSGKYSHYVNWLVFVTNRGRSLVAGQPSGSSFNMYPAAREAELLILSGRFHWGITSIGAQWAVPTSSNSTDEHM